MRNSHLVLPPQTPNGRGNHSCDPNTWWLDAYTLTARRKITAEEEVTNDYATSTDQETFTMTCSCSSPLCRRVISGRDWQSAELQHRYGKHWVPLLLSHPGRGRRHQALTEHRTAIGDRRPADAGLSILIDRAASVNVR